MEEAAGKYREQYSVYATRYGASERTVKRWVALGRERKEPCPLDDPERMREWWAANMSQRCPDKLLAAAVAFRKAGGVAAEKPAAPAVMMELPVQSPPPRREIQPVSEEEVGMEASLRRLQLAEVQAHRVYEEALMSQDEAKMKLAMKAFTDVADKVASLERRVTEHRERTKDLIPRLQAEECLADFHVEFHNRLRSMAEAVFRAFGISVTPENEARWHALMDGLCECLQTEVFVVE